MISPGILSSREKIGGTHGRGKNYLFVCSSKIVTLPIQGENESKKGGKLNNLIPDYLII